MTRWVILTGEYPPQAGGVADYTRLVAAGLAAAGDVVTVYAPLALGPSPADPGVAVHRLPGRFGPPALVELGNRLDRLKPPFRLLVQYVPHAFGSKAMNLPFCLWLFCQRRASLWVMFHEVAFGVDRAQSWKHNFLGHVNRWMASLLVRAAERLFVSVPAWESLVRSLAPGCPPLTLLPVPANVTSCPNSERVRRLRAVMAPDPESVVVGHFGTFGTSIRPMLEAILPALLAEQPNRRAILIGSGGDEFARNLEQLHPTLKGRLFAPGWVPEDEVATHLATCDLLVQPFPDGVSSRRTSLMAGLALGLPIVTTEGHLSEPLWRESGAVALAPVGELQTLINTVESLLADPVKRARLGQCGAKTYAERFTLGRVVEVLQSFP